MGLPQLETCCFVFDLKTGNIIMGGINAAESVREQVIESMSDSDGGHRILYIHQDSYNGFVLISTVMSFVLFIIMMVMAIIMGKIEPTGIDDEYDAYMTGLYVMCILLTIMFLIRFLFDVLFIYGVIIDKAAIIKAYFIVWVIIFIMSTSIFFLHFEAFNIGTICTELLHIGANIYTILLSHSFYVQLNSREEV